MKLFESGMDLSPRAEARRLQVRWAMDDSAKCTHFAYNVRIMRRSSNRSSTPSLRTTDLLVLAILGEGPLHGYAIAQQLEQRTDGHVRVRPGDLYRVLYRLHAAGWLEDAPDANRPTVDDRRAYYRITPLGRKVAREQAVVLSRAFAPLLTKAAAGKAGR